ncbi:MAG: hypothetical protein RIQ94_404 [Pseudomonadota bacterium]|jgi:hypothetical protein
MFIKLVGLQVVMNYFYVGTALAAKIVAKAVPKLVIFPKNLSFQNLDGLSQRLYPFGIRSRYPHDRI